MKYFKLLLIGILLLPNFVSAQEESEIVENNSMLENAVSGVLIEATTKEVLYDKNMNEQVSVASLTKMVGLIIIMEHLEEEKIKLTDEVTITSNASSMGGTQIFLETGEVMTVEDLIKGITMASANDAIVAMAEYISGSEEAFVKIMNEKVKELNLENTSFKNCTGFDEEGHYSSAYDMAIIASELVMHEEIFTFSSIYEDYLRENTEDKFWLVNTNQLVRFYEGADGLKTGYTDAAKSTIAATAKRDDMRLIAISLGYEDKTTRNEETMELLDYGFNTYKVTTLKTTEDIIDNLNLTKANKQSVDIVPSYNVQVISKKTEQEKEYNIKTDIYEITLPLKPGDIVGKMTVYDENNKVNEVDLTVTENIERVGYFELLFNTIRDIITGTINL